MNRLSAAQKQKVIEFKNITGATDQQALDLLSKSNYDVNASANRFFELGYAGSQQKGGAVAIKPQVEALYNTYADANSNKIEVDGVAKFFEDIGLDLMDATTLVISYHLGAKKSGEYTKEEFCLGLQRLNLSTIAEVKARVAALRKELDSDEGFKRVYNFTFAFSKENAKCLDFETAKVLWSILLPFKFTFHKEWLQFLEQLPKDKQKDVTNDLWSMLYEFQVQTKGNLNSYDPYSAWPTIIDEFMAFMGHTPPEESY